MIDDLVLFLYEKNIGKKVTLGYAYRMFAAWQRKINRYIDAFNKSGISKGGNSNRKGAIDTSNYKPPAWWFTEADKL